MYKQTSPEKSPALEAMGPSLTQNVFMCSLSVVSMLEDENKTLNDQDTQIGSGDNAYLNHDLLQTGSNCLSMEYCSHEDVFPVNHLLQTKQLELEDDVGLAFDDLDLEYGGPDTGPAEPSDCIESAGGKLLWINQDQGLSECDTMLEYHDEKEGRQVEENPAEMEDSLLDMYKRIALLARNDPNLPSLNQLQLFEDIMQEMKYMKGYPSQQISTSDLIKLAGTQYMENSYNRDHYSLGREDEAGLGLIHTLLRCAEKVGEQRHGNAVDHLLSICRSLASPLGNPVQRVSYYFAEALRERADHTKLNHNRKSHTPDLHTKLREVEMAFLALYQALPYGKALHFTANQAILEAVGDAKRIHVIDFDIRLGFQWPGLMQALAIIRSDRNPPKVLKLTAVGTDREKLERTGKRLGELAESLNLAFIFKTVVVKRMEELHQGLFDIQPDEALAINASIVMQSFLWKEESLEWLVRVVKGSNPLVFIVIETEAHHNSPSFINRFIEVLFFYSAMFDSLEASLDRNSMDRLLIERNCLGTGITNMVAREGKERLIRHVGTDDWRSFLRRAGFSDVAFSSWAMYQARMLMSNIVDNYNYKASDGFTPFTLVEEGFTLTLGWKETPIYSVSAWTPNSLLPNN